MRTDYFNRMNKPTLLQISYLRELSQLEPRQRKRGAVSLVAERCGVNHAAVSRFFKTCHDAGYIDQKNRLTEDGQVWLSYYLEIVEGVERYLRESGVPESELLPNMQAMVEGMDDYVVRQILDKTAKLKSRAKKLTWIEEPRSKNPLNGLIERGTYEVGFRLLKFARGTSQVVIGVSMADAGFEKPATLKANNRGLFLELTVCDLQAKSRLTGHTMRGHMTSLKYERDGELLSAQIRKGKVLIPLDACSYSMRGNGAVTGTIVVTLTCSVGRIHMPESSALLVFWL